MHKLIFPCRVLAADFDQAVAEVVALIHQRGYLPAEDPRPYKAPVQCREDATWYECYCEVMMP